MLAGHAQVAACVVPDAFKAVETCLVAMAVDCLGMCRLAPSIAYLTLCTPDEAAFHLRETWRKSAGPPAGSPSSSGIQCAMHPHAHTRVRPRPGHCHSHLFAYQGLGAQTALMLFAAATQLPCCKVSPQRLATL